MKALLQDGQDRWTRYRISPVPDSLHKESDSLHSDNDLLEIAETARINKRLPPKQMESILLRLCENRWMMRKQLAELLERNEESLRSRFLAPMVEHGLLCLRYPEKPNRVDQAYAKNTIEPTL